jgi:hypothetical protein
VIRSKKEVLETLRRTGTYRLIEGNEDKLPDPVDVDRDEPLLAELGITRNLLVENMGASP